jgi:rhamnose transport system ATP-binding protein
MTEVSHTVPRSGIATFGDRPSKACSPVGKTKNKPSTAMPPLLQLRAVAKAFVAARALSGVSFELWPGEVHALLGENGAGKSTLIKIISGALQPDSGTLHVAGETVAHFTPAAARKLGIACIYQQPALFPDLSVAENIALRLESPGPFRIVSWRERRNRATQLLEQLGARIDPTREIRQLSMPEQQLVEIACVLGARARIVLMDEPTASLTRREQELLFAAVRELRRSGVGVIYITHRLEEIFALADRVTVLRDGENVATTPVSESNESLLIRQMVGRTVDQIYPPSESEPGPPLLCLKNLGCSAGGIHDVSLELRAGEVVGLAGLIGSGRTELARTIFGITPADSGELLLEDQRVQIESPRQAIAHGIALLPEDRRRHGVVMEMSVAANITLASLRHVFPGGWLQPSKERSLAGDLMGELGVRAAGPDAPALSLSGGNQQKVALARWFPTKPKILLLDEPTQGVDVGAKAEIHKQIRSLAKSGVAVLLVSSDLPEILGMSDRIAVMRGGTIVSNFPGKADAHAVMAAALGQT